MEKIDINIYIGVKKIPFRTILVTIDDQFETNDKLYTNIVYEKQNITYSPFIRYIAL